MKAFASLTAVALLTLSLPSAAESSFTTYIERLFPYAAGAIDVVFTDSPSACTNTSAPKRFRLQAGASGATADGAKQVYAALLYASASSKKVTVYFDETAGTCNIIRLYVYNQ